MPTPASCDEFLALVRKCEVVDQGKLETCLQKLRQQGPLPAEPRKLATLLVEEGVLTRFYREQLLLGKYRGFNIGKYRVLERLGAGGMGKVFLAEHVDMHRRVALKILSNERMRDPAMVERFRREARAVAALNHPNIVRALDFNQEGEVLFLVMEYVDGVSLQELVAKHGPLEHIRAAHYIRQAATGLQHAHEAGLVHRDIKPANILIDRGGVVKLLDMSLARFLNDQGASLTAVHNEKSVLGTADYLSPEQALDSHEVDIRTDIYSLGATFFFLLVGSPPFADGTAAQKVLWHQVRTPRPVRDFRSEVPAELAAVINKMMAKEPGFRYQTPAELVEALSEWTQTPIPPLADHELRRLSPAVMTVGPSTGRFTGLATKVREAVQAEVETPMGAAAVTKVASKPPQEIIPPVEEVIELVPSSPVRKTSHAWIAALAVALLILASGAGAALYFWPTPSPTPNPDDPPRVHNREVQIPELVPEPTPEPEARSPLVVSRSGEAGTYSSLSAAWASARSGDLILVQEEVIEEILRLDGTKGARKEVVIQGKSPSGKPVLWHPPADVEKGQALLLVSQQGQVRLEGFRLDGQNRVTDLIVIAGRCPGLTLQDLQGEGFQCAAIRLSGCVGDEAQPVSLLRLRLLAGSEKAAAFLFEKSNEHLQVLDSRIEGPYKAGVQLAGGLVHAAFRRNRFAKMNDGFSYKKGTPPYPLHLALTSNTFFDLDRGLHFETAPPANQVNQLVAQHNLFLQTKKIAVTDGVPTEPKGVLAHWIWSDEAKGPIPAEERYFRRAFELSGPMPSRAILDVGCDDAFTVWLNGVQVGRSSTGHYTKRVYGFDVTTYLRSGKNVLAIQGTNLNDFVAAKTTEAALLVQLSCTTGATTTTPVLSDKSWKVAKKAPNGWQQIEFNDSTWAAVKVLEQYGKGRDGKGSGPWVNLIWDSMVRQHFRDASTLTPICTGNWRDYRTTEGYPPFDARGSNITLPTDPAKDEQFLRYPKTSPLFQAGIDKTPVGVPPPE